jgi:hypothetical protein
MRGRLPLVFALWTAVAAGCGTVDETRTTAWLPHFNPFQGPTGPDVIHMEVALLERPLGDRYINGELWEQADERLIGPQRQALMEGSGFRIGLVSGLMTPPDLLALLTSKRCCVNPRGRQVRAGHPTSVKLGPAVPQCRFRIEQDGRPVDVEFEQAELRLRVVPALMKDGRTTLRCTPQVLHGEMTSVYRPADDHSGWLMDNQRPAEDYTALNWEASLAPSEYLVIGGRYDRPDTLGHQCFVRPDETVPVQRLLVIRSRPQQRQPEASSPAVPTESSKTVPASAPLALQAARSAVRGSFP